MIQSKWKYLTLKTVALVAFAAIPVCGDPGEIRPLHTTAYFSKENSATPWKAYVLNLGGKRAYKLSFDPEYDLKGAVVGVNLVLTDSQKKQGTRGTNPLSPGGNWHRLQPYMFPGRGLAQGLDKSGFGSRRELKLVGRNLLVRMDISVARVSPLPYGDYRIDLLQIEITVDNDK